MQNEIILSAKQINRFALIFILVIAAFLYLPFSLVWGWHYTLNGLKSQITDLLFWIIPIILVHEGLHGLVWALASKSFTNISFGFNREMVAPYTHCKVPLSKTAYILGGLAPLFILGIVPTIIAFVFGKPYWFVLALFCIFTAGGDIYSCFFLIKVPNKFKIQDHPEKLGFIVMED